VDSVKKDIHSKEEVIGEIVNPLSMTLYKECFDLFKPKIFYKNLSYEYFNLAIVTYNIL
jgi:hypothetical protein